MCVCVCCGVQFLAAPTPPPSFVLCGIYRPIMAMSYRPFVCLTHTYVRTHMHVAAAVSVSSQCKHGNIACVRAHSTLCV